MGAGGGGGGGEMQLIWEWRTCRHLSNSVR